MSYIVTGGAGFVGSNMVRKLNEKGISDVVIIDNYEEAKMPNLVGLQFIDYIDFSNGLASVKESLEAIDNVQGIFHIGANADVLENDSKVMMVMNYEFSKLYCDFAVRCLITSTHGRNGSLINTLTAIKSDFRTTRSLDSGSSMYLDGESSIKERMPISYIASTG